MQSHQDMTKLPLYQIDEVWHVGSFNVADKNMHGSSQEGTGVSVSEYPDDWCEIAELGGYPTWRLTRAGGTFLDYHQMSQVQRDALVSWGISNGYVRMHDMFKMSFYDSEYEETRFMLLDTREDAELEGEDMEDAVIEQVSVPYPTEAMSIRLGFKAEPLGAQDFLATFYVEDETELDGVWWHDNHAPEELSAPRGVIVLRALSGWAREVETDTES